MLVELEVRHTKLPKPLRAAHSSTLLTGKGLISEL